MMIRRTVHRTLLCSFAFSLAAAAVSAQTPAQLPDAPSTTAHEAPPAVPTGPSILIDTTMGRLVCQLFDKEAPLTAANFIGLATGAKPYTDPTTAQQVTGKPFYDGTTFHRVIPGFMIQGGDKLGNGSGDAGYYVQDEIVPSLRFDIPGRLAMANSGPNTNGSQFFITEASQPALNGHYSIFGQCDEHTVLVVGSIARVERNSEDKPTTPVVINKVTVIPAGTPVPPVPIPPGPQNVIPPGALPVSRPPTAQQQPPPQ